MEPTVPESLEAARRKGFNQGMSTALTCLTGGATLWISFAIVKYVPDFREVFQQVHIEMPALTVLVMTHYVLPTLVLLLAFGVAVFATVTRGDQRVSLILNIAAFFLALSWLGACVVALFLPLASLLKEIGRKH